MRVAFFLILLSWAASVAVASTTLYKSVGPDGKVTYTDRPPADGRIEKTIEYVSLPSSELPPSAVAYAEQLRKSSSSSTNVAGLNGVALFTASWCGYCKKAKAYLPAKGISYKEFDVESPGGMTAYAQAGGTRGVLSIFHGWRISPALRPR